MLGLFWKVSGETMSVIPLANIQTEPLYGQRKVNPAEKCILNEVITFNTDRAARYGCPLLSLDLNMMMVISAWRKVL